MRGVGRAGMSGGAAAAAQTLGRNWALRNCNIPCCTAAVNLVFVQRTMNEALAS
jgi:hypothetical protein